MFRFSLRLSFFCSLTSYLSKSLHQRDSSNWKQEPEEEILSLTCRFCIFTSKCTVHFSSSASSVNKLHTFNTYRLMSGFIRPSVTEQWYHWSVFPVGGITFSFMNTNPALNQTIYLNLVQACVFSVISGKPWKPSTWSEAKVSPSPSSGWLLYRSQTPPPPCLQMGSSLDEGIK